MSGQPGAGGPPPGVDTAQLASMQQAQGQMGQGMTGAHEFIFRGKPDHGLKPAHMGTFTGNLIPKPFGVPKPGGGINKNAKPMDIKKKGYAPAPGQAEHVKQGGAEHVNPQKAQHTDQNFRHLQAMGIGGWQNHPAFAGLNPFVGMSSPFQGMGLYAGRMSPHAMMNMAPVTGVFNAPSMNEGANIAQSAQASIAAAQAAQAAASRGNQR